MTDLADNRVLFAADRFQVVEAEQTARDGRILKRQVIRHPGAVVILPLLEGDRVVLIRNERVAVGATLIELPAGTLDHDEPPLAAAQRELQEETGYRAECWRELPAFWMSPGILRERMHPFVAEELSAGQHAREPGENIDNLIVSFDEALHMCDQGDIADAQTICTLLQWDRIRRSRTA